MGPPMLWLSKATAPAVWLLDRSSALIFRLLGLQRETENM
jgi:putative hemolysin